MLYSLYLKLAHVSLCIGSSRPGSSLSQQSTSSLASTVNMRVKSAGPRKPRPITMAGTGITHDSNKNSVICDKKIIDNASKPPISKIRKSNIEKPPSEKGEKHKTTVNKSVPKIVPVLSPTTDVAPKDITKLPQSEPVKEVNKNNNRQQNISEKIESVVKLPKSEDTDKDIVITKNIEATEQVEVTETPVMTVKTPVAVVEETEETKNIVEKSLTEEKEKVPKIKQELVEKTPAPENLLENIEMTASVVAKTRITTEEEAKAALAERRRLAREEAERQALAEKLRLEQEEERQRQEEEQLKKLAEEQRKAEEERLAQVKTLIINS